MLIQILRFQCGLCKAIYEEEYPVLPFAELVRPGIPPGWCYIPREMSANVVGFICDAHVAEVSFKTIPKKGK